MSARASQSCQTGTAQNRETRSRTKQLNATIDIDRVGTESQELQLWAAVSN